MNSSSSHVGTFGEMPEEPGSCRYGIFIRPPAEVAAPVLEMLHIARDLFGFHAACAYPPHITLIGSIVLTGTEDELIEAIGTVVQHRPPISMFGTGLDAPIAAAVGFDYTRLVDGSVNTALPDLYEQLRVSISQLRGFEESDWKAAERRAKEAPELFTAHMTVIGHDGIDNAILREEAKQVLDVSAASVPAHWDATTVTVYRLWSADWSGKYWLTQEWVPLYSWTLAS